MRLVNKTLKNSFLLLLITSRKKPSHLQFERVSSIDWLFFLLKGFHIILISKILEHFFLKENWQTDTETCKEM